MDANAALNRLIEKLEGSVARAEKRIAEEWIESLQPYNRGLLAGYKSALADATMLKSLVEA